MSDLLLTLAIIVKNSENTIAKTLNSVIDIVDEIIIIDTGSTDNTKSVLECFVSSSMNSVKLFHYEWENDFSKARNTAIEKVSGKWILFLDSDEYMTNDDKLILEKAIQSDNIGVYYLKIKSYFENSSIVINKLPRLFRNIEGIRYNYAIHEMLDESSLGEYNLKSEELDITLEHYGYFKKEVYQHKNKRNLNILKKKLLKEQLNKEEYFHYGAYFLLSCLNTISSSMEKSVGTQLIEIKNIVINDKEFSLNQDFFIFYSCIGNFILKYNMIELLPKLLSEIKFFYPESPYLIYKMAEIYYKLEQYEKSIELLNECLSFQNKPYKEEQLLEPGILSHLTYYALVKCYKETGKKDKIDFYNKRIMEINPEFYDKSLKNII